MKKALYILIPLLIAVTLRLYPTLTTGMPFSTDGWPIIKNVELLLRNTPVPLDNALFDGYNSFMPANSIFGAVLSQVTNLPAITVMALGMPIAGALAIPIFYVLTNRITKNAKVSLVASTLLAAAFPYAMFTAGVTKETFASPIYISLLLVFLLKHNWKTTLLFSFVSVTLVMSHLATTVLTVGMVAGLTIGLFVNKTGKEQNFNSNKSNIVFTSILSVIAALYFGLYAYPAFNMTITPSDVLTVASYLAIVAVMTIYFVYKPVKPTFSTTALKCALSFLVPFAIFFVETRIPVLPGAPTLPIHYFLYALPFLISAPLILYGLNELNRNNFQLIIPVFWLAPLIGFAAWSVFADPLGGVGYAYRLINFMLPPLLILASIVLAKIAKSKSNSHIVHSRRFVKFGAVAVIAIMAVTSTYTLYSAVSLQEPYLGYFWSYKPSEYTASDWIAANGSNQTITADVKTHDLLDDYFKVNVSVEPGLTFLEGKGSEPNILYIYNQMKTNGYVLYQGSAISLPANWINNLADYNIIFANSEVTIYAKR